MLALHDNIAVTPDEEFHAIVQAFTQAKIDIARLEQELERLAVPPAVQRRSNAERPKSLTPDQIRHARQSIDNGQENVSSMAKLMKVNKTTLWRALQPDKEGHRACFRTLVTCSAILTDCPKAKRASRPRERSRD